MISLDQARELASTYNVIPLSKRLFSGTETPVGVYQKLAKTNPNTFLLESAEQGVWGRYSFIGLKSRGQLIADDSGVRFEGLDSALPDSSELLGTPLEALEQMQTAWRSSPTDFPLNSGLVGFLSWGAVNFIENLPISKPADYQIPLYAFNQFSELIVMDHKTAELIVVAVMHLESGANLESKYDLAQSQIHELVLRLSEPTPSLISEPNWPEPSFIKRTEKADYLSQIAQAKEHVRAGDVFQVVISQRFDHEISVDALEVYRALRAVNPSPYMYLLRFQDKIGDFSIVGSSPEALVKISGDSAIMHPIAGSRPRGKDTQSDIAMAEELQKDEKERSEHLMLVDLARNDLLKVCDPDSVHVSEYMQVHRFSHIMHLVSTVEGRLLEAMGPVSCLRATFPAGTLSGAPKPRALEIIHELEPGYRGLFGGVVGYFDFQGNSDLAIAIRTALIRDGIAHVQAGAGIVLDSNPESEYAETEAKAAVVLRAIAAANAMGHA